MKQLALRTSCRTAFLAAAAVLSLEGTAAATTGVMYVSGYKALTENHYGTIVVREFGRLDCKGYSIFNSTQAAVCEDSDEQFQCGVFVTQTTIGNNNVVQNCNVENFPVGMAVTYAGSDSLLLANNTLTNNDDGLKISYPSSTSFNIDNVDVASNSDEGIRILGGYITIQNSDVRWNGVDGIDSDDFAYLRIANNTLVENADHNIELDNGYQAHIASNSVDGYVSGGVAIETERDGIQLDGVTTFTVSSNTVRDSGRHGIFIRNSRNGSVTGNNVARSARVATNGRDCYRETGATITFSSNTFTNHTGCTTLP